MKKILRFRITWAEIESNLYFSLSMILYPLLAIGIIAYIIRYIAALVNQETITSPLELAGVAGTIGGLILLGAFYKDKDAETQQGRELKTIAKLFLGAAVSFTALFLLLEVVRTVTSPTLNWAEWLLVCVTSLTIVAAGLTFGFALAFLIRVIRHL